MDSVPLNLHPRTALAIVAATVGAALFAAAPTAEARPINVIGVGTIEIPDEIPLPADFPGAWSIPAPGVFVAPQQTLGERAVAAARTKLGSGYRTGGTGPDAFDCSGLVQWSYGQAGQQVPRTSYQQLDSGTPVPLDQLQPGDVVSFYGGSHSALYAGDGMVIHAATYGQGVELAPMSSMPVVGARRF